MIRAVLFDMDGVLIDARDWHFEALNRALDIFGMAIDRDAHLATFDGLPTRQKLAILTASRGLPARLHGFISEMKQRFTVETIHARCRPRFQQSFALARLKADDYRLAVCSNSIRSSIELMMEASQLAPHLDLIISNEDVPRAKPAPDMYIAAMKHFGLAPEECLIVEDSDHGIQAAQASGGHLLIVSSPADLTFARIQRAIADATP